MKDNLNKIWNQHDGKGMPIFLRNEKFEVRLRDGTHVKNQLNGWDWDINPGHPEEVHSRDVMFWRYIVAEDYVKQASENTRSGLYYQPSSGISISNTFNDTIFTKYEPSKIPMNKYQKIIYGKDQNGNVVKCIVDVYDVLEAWKTTNPALQHLTKKALQPGERGHKSLVDDLKDIIASAQRALEIEQSKEVLK
ncbi:hypothetical protein OMDBNIEC_00021 [Salmonella phage STP-SP5]|nr:hypothetical protein OMDBNIEC_00021 [Salmonella phage STP-SP5]